MNISILQICLISLFYCFSNISWPFGSMGQWATINRPLVGGLVVGLILGNPVQGTIIGATINVIYLGLVSAGGSLPADSGMAGIMGYYIRSDRRPRYEHRSGTGRSYGPCRRCDRSSDHDRPVHAHSSG